MQSLLKQKNIKNVAKLNFNNINYVWDFNFYLIWERNRINLSILKKYLKTDLLLIINKLILFKYCYITLILIYSFLLTDAYIFLNIDELLEFLILNRN